MLRLLSKRHSHRFDTFVWRSITPNFIVTCWSCRCGQKRIETT